MPRTYAKHITVLGARLNLEWSCIERPQVPGT
jgi:hypothetical protein